MGAPLFGPETLELDAGTGLHGKGDYGRQESGVVRGCQDC